MAEKKQLTTTELKKKYNRIAIITDIFQYVSMALPYLIVGIINWDKYFVEYSGVKISITFVLGMIVLGLTLYGTVNKKLKSTAWSLMLKLVILSIICFLLGSLITDLGFILLCGAVGLIGSAILSDVSKKYKEKRDFVGDAIKEAEKDVLKEQAKKEKELDAIR